MKEDRGQLICSQAFYAFVSVIFKPLALTLSHIKLIYLLPVWVAPVIACLLDTPSWPPMYLVKKNFRHLLHIKSGEVGNLPVKIRTDACGGSRGVFFRTHYNRGERFQTRPRERLHLRVCLWKTIENIRRVILRENKRQYNCRNTHGTTPAGNYASCFPVDVNEHVNRSNRNINMVSLYMADMKLRRKCNFPPVVVG